VRKTFLSASKGDGTRQPFGPIAALYEIAPTHKLIAEASMIRLESISKSYGGSVVIDSVTVTIQRSRTTALIGPSASGKSTLLALIIGLESPDKGAIMIGSNPLTSRSALSLRHRMGYVIQDGGLFPHLSARQNIDLMAKEVGWAPKRRCERIDELCALTRFPPAALDRFPIELSGGQRQRVSLMRALMLDPDILLMDEPLGALDPMIRAELQGELKSIFRSLAKTVVLVTHDLGEAAFFGDTIILMQSGRIVQQGQFRDLVERPAETFVVQFVHTQLRRLAIINEQALTAGARST